MTVPSIDMKWNKKTTTVVIILLLILGAGLRLATVPFSSVWLDEANSILGASRSLPGIIDFLHTQENGPPLFYFLLHFWIKLFGDRDFVCALMPAVFSVLTPIFVYFLSAELFGKKAGIWATFLYSVNTRSIAEATNIRFYSLLELLTVFSYLVFFKMLKNKRLFWIYLVISVLGIYEHYYFAFVLLSQFAICLIFHRRRAFALAVALIIILACFLPWIPTFIKQFSSGANTWLQPVFGPRHFMSLLYTTVFLDSGIFLDQYIPFFRAAVYSFSALLLLVWSIRLASRRASIPMDEEHISVYSLVIAYALSVGLPILISMVQPIYYPGRYDIIGLPLLIIFLAWAFSKIKNGWLVLFLIVFYLAKTFDYQLLCIDNPTPDKTTSRKLAEIIGPDDIIVHTSLSKLPTEYYLNQYGVSLKKSYMFPSELENHPCWRDLYKWRAKAEKFKYDARSIANSLEEEATSRIFVLYREDPEEEKEISDYLITEMDKRFDLDRTCPWGASFYEKILVYRVKSE